MKKQFVKSEKKNAEARPCCPCCELNRADRRRTDSLCQDCVRKQVEDRWREEEFAQQEMS